MTDSFLQPLVQLITIPPLSLLSTALLRYTILLVKKVALDCLADDITGHLSLTFGISEDLASAASAKSNFTEKEVREIFAKAWVTDLRPSPAHGVLAFADLPEDMASG